MKDNAALNALRYHVSGAIARGEKKAISEQVERADVKTVNGIGPAVGLQPRDYLRERDASKAAKHRRNKRAEREWHPTRNLHPGEG